MCNIRNIDYKCLLQTHRERQPDAVESVASLFRCGVFWQLVAVTRWELCLEETPAIQTQEVASASASLTDITAISVWCGSKLHCQPQFGYFTSVYIYMCV